MILSIVIRSLLLTSQQLKQLSKSSSHLKVTNTISIALPRLFFLQKAQAQIVAVGSRIMNAERCVLRMIFNLTLFRFKWILQSLFTIVIRDAKHRVSTIRCFVETRCLASLCGKIPVYLWFST